MTSSHLIDTEQLLADQLAQASPDLLRGLLSTFIAALMGAEADAVCRRFALSALSALMVRSDRQSPYPCSDARAQ